MLSSIVSEPWSSASAWVKNVGGSHSVDKSSVPVLRRSLSVRTKDPAMNASRYHLIHSGIPPFLAASWFGSDSVSTVTAIAVFGNQASKFSSYETELTLPVSMDLGWHCIGLFRSHYAHTWCRWSGLDRRSIENFVLHSGIRLPCVFYCNDHWWVTLNRDWF